MSNNYFQFKQFTIYQEECSMKVCTDACIFGAWIADKVAVHQHPVRRCLDIGTGTGLLSLMIAQKSNTLIDALEIEPNAFEQANANFQNSTWSERLQIFNCDAREFISPCKYDLIISNPPFFENDLLSENISKNFAKHNAGFNLSELLIIIKNSISATGSFAILLPYHRTEYFKKLAYENEFHLQEKLLIKQTPDHNFFRTILWFTKQNTTTGTSELIIKNKENNYTDEFIHLLINYYLNL